MDGDLFLTLLKQEQDVDTTIWENDLIIGDPEAPILITVACNPYCNPCAKAHKKLDEILNKYPNIIKVQIRFICNDKALNDKRTIAVKSILQVVEVHDNKKEILNDWFELMNLELWQIKWHSDKVIELNSKIESHSNWISKSNIKFTPTVFMNGRKIPDRYNIDDIDQIVPFITKIY